MSLFLVCLLLRTLQGTDQSHPLRKLSLMLRAWSYTVWVQNLES